MFPSCDLFSSSELPRSGRAHESGLTKSKSLSSSESSSKTGNSIRLVLSTSSDSTLAGLSGGRRVEGGDEGMGAEDEDSLVLAVVWTLSQVVVAHFGWMNTYWISCCGFYLLSLVVCTSFSKIQDQKSLRAMTGCAHPQDNRSRMQRDQPSACNVSFNFPVYHPPGHRLKCAPDPQDFTCLASGDFT